MDGQNKPEILPPVIPMPAGDHIIVSDPFIDDFVTSPRSHCAYSANYASAPYNYYTNTYASTIPTPSYTYTNQPSIGGQSTTEIPIGALGRLFPGDQPVIVQNSISPTHPYIPPVFPCGLCRREILDNVQAVHCYLGCKFWFHRTCVDLSEETFQLLLKDPYAEWMCDPCFDLKKDSVDEGQYKIIHRNQYYSSN